MLKRYKRWRFFNPDVAMPIEIAVAIVTIAVLFLVVALVGSDFSFSGTHDEPSIGTTH